MSSVARHSTQWLFKARWWLKKKLLFTDLLICGHVDPFEIESYSLHRC